MMINKKILPPIPYTDYVVEQGSNYIKYNSGTMIQWGAAIVTDAFQTPAGNMYRTANMQSVSFFQEFISNGAAVFLTPLAAINAVYLGSSPTKTGFGFWPLTLTSAAAATRYVNWFAIGKWK